LKPTILRAATVFLFIFAASAVASAQASNAAPPEQHASATADEDFDLNIAERRISERDFHAETAIGTSSDGLNLNVGVTVRAGDINLLLRNVRGHVRFRANLEPVLRFLDARHRPPSAAPSQPNTSP
jgi:hypothetical protein